MSITIAHLPARVADRLAGVARLEHRKLLVVLGELLRERAQRLGAVARVEGAPRRVGLPRTGDRRIHLGDPGARDLLEHRLGRGLYN